MEQMQIISLSILIIIKPRTRVCTRSRSSFIITGNIVKPDHLNLGLIFSHFRSTQKYNFLSIITCWTCLPSHKIVRGEYIGEAELEVCLAEDGRSLSVSGSDYRRPQDRQHARLTVSSHVSIFTNFISAPHLCFGQAGAGEAGDEQHEALWGGEGGLYDVGKHWPG